MKLIRRSSDLVFQQKNTLVVNLYQRMTGQPILKKGTRYFLLDGTPISYQEMLIAVEEDYIIKEERVYAVYEKNNSSINNNSVKNN